MADAIFQTDYAKGILTPPRPQTYGAVHVAKVKHVFSVTTDENDIVEMFTLPAYAQLVDWLLVPEGTMTGITADVGLMSGDPGSTATSRTSGDELFDAIALDGGVKRATEVDGFNIAPVEYDRSIGLKLSDEVAGASTKKVTLIVKFAM